jgi:hypothetical protein
LAKSRFDYEGRPDTRHYSIDGIDYTAKRRPKTINVMGPVTLADSVYDIQALLKPQA